MHSLSDVNPTYERLFAPFAISPGVVLPPGEYRLRDVCAPGDAALPGLAAVPIVIAQRCQRRGIARLQLRAS